MPRVNIEPNIVPNPRYSICNIEARFESIEKIKELSTQTLQNDNIMMSLLYLGCRTSQIEINNIPPEVKLVWILTTLPYRRENKMDIIQITKDATQNWRGKTMDVLIQVAMSNLENLSEKDLRGRYRITIAHGREEAYMLQMWKEEHLRSKCFPPQKEKVQEEKN